MSRFRAVWRFLGSIDCAILVCIANVIAANVIGDYNRMSIWIVGTFIMSHMREKK